MQIIWLTQGGFLFAHRGQRLVADPYMSDCLAAKGLPRLVPFPMPLAELKPEVLLCTHDHLDHFDPESVGQIAAAYPQCLLAGAANSHKHFLAMGLDRERCRLLEIGKRETLAGMDVLPVFAKHSDAAAIGVVVSAGGKRVYLTGDTEFDERLFAAPEVRGVDLLLICINGRMGNMTLDEAVATVKRLAPKAAAPMHYGLFARNTADPAPFVAQCQEVGIKAFAMQPGKEFAI